MERKFYRFSDEDNYIISITEEQKKVFEWLSSIGYEFNLELLDFEKTIEI